MANKKVKSSALKQSYSLSDVWKKHKILIVVLVILFSGLGAYLIKTSSAGTFVEASTFGYGCRSTPTIGVGNQGPCVSVVQNALNNWSCSQKFTTSSGKSPYNYVPLKVDGIFGQNTKAKVIEYQNAKNVQGKNLAADGVVGPATWLTIQTDNTAWASCDYTKGFPVGKG